MLERNGYCVHVHNDPKQGLDSIPGLQPDLVLMDIVMPGINGYQATRQISRNPRTSQTPVIILSCRGSDTDRIWGIRQGALDYLVKPVSEKELIKSVANALAL